jgi:NAD(P)-dependent dehydrogenase (short-subunit alcohol dehydrogenase family)
MSEMRFDGRVALVTGAGRALGRAHAMLLAERGAKVVVNDLGGNADGTGGDAGPAHEVAREISNLGGQAIASTDSVSDPAGAEAMVAAAIGHFGRLDIVVNNAGILTADDFPSVAPDVFQRHLSVHLIGSFNVTRAAWPHFVEQGYGRVLMTVSSGMLGSGGVISYASAKFGVVGLMRTLAQLGAPQGITVNAFAPAAFSRLIGNPQIRARAGLSADASQVAAGRGTPEQVVPPAAYLVHESCHATGEIITSTGTHVARLFVASTRGHTAVGISPEAVRDHWDDICGEDGYVVVRSTAEHKALIADLSLPTAQA